MIDKNFYTGLYESHCNYLVYQQEVCPDTKRTHIQGFLQLKTKKRLATMKSLISKATHWEKRRGCANDAAAYCKKIESRMENGIHDELGQISRQGERTDCETIVDMVKKRKRDDEIIDMCPQAARMEKAIKFVRKSYLKRDFGYKFREMYVEVIIGKAGVGKTRGVYEKHGYENVYRLEPPNVKQGAVWFEEYEGQDVLLIDEMGSWIRYSFLKELLDGHPFRCPFKGGFMPACFTKIYITTTKEVNQWYSFPNIDELTRRIHKITHI